ncbi:lasso peptide biosynthesis B2 protein [Streptomyces sp. NRRL B-24572]|uniref:lasso peptide biosynthesis B2 protein n=1 Tax=Streptomyces sp. NRRL B-24572 TaxID=1962156 RepID=UPI000A3D4CC6|nr:lasso peptide biosynthesis B2 protein [Streptomyces sp. NRRL B-24572]
MERAVDFGHVLVVVDHRTGRVRCQVPGRSPAPVVAPAASWGSAEHPAGIERPREAWSLSAAAALVAVFAIKRAGSRATAMHRVTTAIRVATSTCRRPATPEQARSAVLAVRRGAWLSPGRTACLEESAAAVLLLAARRLSVTWCHGVAPDPVRLHAWVQTEDGGLVAEPESTRAYTPVLVIGDRSDH